MIDDMTPPPFFQSSIWAIERYIHLHFRKTLLHFKCYISNTLSRCQQFFSSFSILSRKKIYPKAQVISLKSPYNQPFSHITTFSLKRIVWQTILNRIRNEPEVKNPSHVFFFWGELAACPGTAESPNQWQQFTYHTRHRRRSICHIPWCSEQGPEYGLRPCGVCGCACRTGLGVSGW